MKNPRDIIFAPVVSEKSYDLIEDTNTYTFEVDPRANKTQVKQAIETIFDVKGPGIVNHFYLTLMSRDLFVYRRAVLRMFWDDEETPSVEVPIPDTGAGR